MPIVPMGSSEQSVCADPFIRPIIDDLNAIKDTEVGEFLS